MKIDNFFCMTEIHKFNIKKAKLENVHLFFSFKNTALQHFKKDFPYSQSKMCFNLKLYKHA